MVIVTMWVPAFPPFRTRELEEVKHGDPRNTLSVLL